MRIFWIIMSFFTAGVSLPADNLVKNPGFEEGTAHWLELNSTCQIVQGAGRDGSAALRVSRQNLQQPRAVVKQKIALTPGRRYRIGGWIRCEGTPTCSDHDAPKPMVGVECWRGGNYGGGESTWARPIAPQEWTWYETEYTTASDPAAYIALLYACSPTTCGTWLFDDIVIEELPGEWAIGQVFPMHNQVSPEGGDVIFHTFYGDIEPEYQRVEASLLRDGAEVVHWDSMLTGPYSLTLIFPALPAGEYELAAVLYDDRSGEELGRQSLPVSVTDQTHQVTVNEDWTVSVKGEKFLPIGTYCAMTREAVEEMKAAGFNCALTYITIWESLDGKSEHCLASLTKALDNCAANDFKMILSLCMFDPARENVSSWDGVEGNEAILAHLTRSLRNHPALLAWYLADEPPLTRRPWCEKAYDIVKANDPEHPVFIVFNAQSVLPKFTGCSDIFGFDEYPIHGSSSLGNAVPAGEQLDAYNVPFWWVGQIMSWGSYKGPAQDYRYPTEEEMLAQNLLAFINNAKGVVNFSMFNLVKPGDEGLRNRRLEELRRVNTACQELADFILSDAEVPEYWVKVQEGTLKHRLFGNGAGEYRLLLVSPYPGATRASVSLPVGLEFAGSARNAVRQEADGSLTFTGKDVTCDIVTLVAAP